MKAIDAIRIALKFSDMGMKYLGEMSDAPLLRPGGKGGRRPVTASAYVLPPRRSRTQIIRRAPPLPLPTGIVCSNNACRTILVTRRK